MKMGKCGPQPQENQSSENLQMLERTPWLWWRSQMPIAPTWAYFDHSAVAPLSGPAAAAIQHLADEAALLGDTVWPSWAAGLEHLRGQFAQLLNADLSEICLVPNTSTGINLVAEGWPWQPGESVVVPDGEFPSNLFPWLNQASRGVEVRVVARQGGEVRVDDLMSRVDESTRMIAVSWVGYASGFRVDLDRLVEEAHRRDVMVFVDAIQGLGIFPLDVQRTPVDFLAADGHKWLLGPEGLGVAMIAQRHLERLRCGNVGWNSVKSPFQYAEPKLELRSTAARFEPGSANLLGAAGLSASLDLFLRVRACHGEASIGERVLDLAERLDTDLRAAGAVTRQTSDSAHRSGIVTFDVPGIAPAEVRRRAVEQKVVVSCRDGGVRASIHAYNDDEDIRRLVEVVRGCL